MYRSTTLQEASFELDVHVRLHRDGWRMSRSGCIWNINIVRTAEKRYQNFSKIFTRRQCRFRSGAEVPGENSSLYCKQQKSEQPAMGEKFCGEIKRFYDRVYQHVEINDVGSHPFSVENEELAFTPCPVCMP